MRGVPVVPDPHPLAVCPVHLVFAELADLRLLVAVTQAGLGVCTVGVHPVQPVLGRLQCMSLSLTSLTTLLFLLLPPQMGLKSPKRQW